MGRGVPAAHRGLAARGVPLLSARLPLHLVAARAADRTPAQRQLPDPGHGGYGPTARHHRHRVGMLVAVLCGHLDRNGVLTRDQADGSTGRAARHR